MKIKNILISILIFSLYVIPQKNYAQVGCPNANFSEGNFNNWIGTTGYYGNPNVIPGINSFNHQIIDLPYADNKTCDSLISIPEGELYSAKLGNDSGGAQSEKLSFNLIVSPDNSLFIYKYAVVLQDPGHSADSQPGFSVKVIDNTNIPATQITENCGVYEVYAGQPDQDFQTCGDFKWLQWKTIALNLTPYMGRNLSIEFITRDCAYELHYGYAYISAKCSPLRINAKTCSDSNVISLTAPEGFSSYEWFESGSLIGTEQNFIFSNGDYPIGTVFDCIVTAISNGVSCPVTIQTVLGNPITIIPDFSQNSLCGAPNLIAGNQINFQDNSTITNDVIKTWNWDFGDGTTSTDQNPIKIFQNPGSYNVKLKITSLNGCFKVVNNIITIINNLTPSPTGVILQEFCEGSLPNVSNLIATGTNLKWYNSLISTNPLPTTTVLTNSDIYYVSQTISGCESPRLGIEVKFFRSPTPIGNELQYFCSTSNPTIESLTVQGISILWYTSIYTTTPLSNNTPLVNGLSYYASQNNGCGESPIRLKVTVSFDGSVINGNPIQKFCQIDNPTVADLTLNNTNLIWFTSASGGTPIANNTLLQNGLTYYGTSIDLQNCFPRLEVKVILDNLKNKGTNFNQFLCDDSNATLQNVTNFNPKKWYNSPTSQTEINPNEKVTDESIYYYSQIDPISGCENPERYQVKINLIPCDVEVYNAITINNNNQNDLLSIKNIEYFEDNSIEIFDKYGKLVYKTEKYGVNNNLFYGVSKGNDVILKNKKLPTGTYYYVLNIKNNSISINKTKKGFIYIINNE